LTSNFLLIRTLFFLFLFERFVVGNMCATGQWSANCTRWSCFLRRPVMQSKRSLP
jgi:hypothetical protein